MAAKRACIVAAVDFRSLSDALPGRRRALLAFAALALFAAIATQGAGHAKRRPRPAPVARGPSTPLARSAGARAPALYRIVGCRSRGAGAYRRGPAVRAVAIGFDDGPAADTPAFLTMLERSRATATFFMIGNRLSSAYTPMLLRELRDGDALGDHTFTHPDLRTSRNVRGQLLHTLATIRSLSGYAPCVFRPPYGGYSRSVVRIASSLGLATVLWNVDPSDYAQPGRRAIERRVVDQVRPGSIVVSHDGGGPRGQTLAAYPSIIAALRARGYRLVTIPQLLGFRPVYVPCVHLCEGIGVTKDALPRGAIVEHAA